MKIVLQDGIKDCGVCCLLSIIRYYGGDVSKEYLRQLTNTTKSGVTAWKLVEAARKFGFDSMGVKGDLKNIDINNLPCLAHIIYKKSYQHFVVIYEIDLTKENLIIMDPSYGKKKLSFSEFRLLSSNNFIYLKPQKKLPILKEKKIIKTTILSFIKKNKIICIFIITLTLIYFLFNLIVAFHFKYLLEYAINYNNQKNIFYITYIIVIIYLFKEIIDYLRNILIIKYSEILDQIITLKTYKQIILLPYIYYKNRTTGEVISRMKDLNTTKNFYVKLISSLSTDIITVIIFIILLFNINKTLSFIVISIIFSLFIINILIKNPKKKLINKYTRLEEKINSNLIESLSSVETIKGVHIEYDILDKFNNIYQNLLEVAYKLSRILQLDKLLKNILNNFLLTIVFSLGTLLVINKKLTLGELIIYQSIINYLLIATNNLVTLQNEYPNFSLALKRVEDIFNIRKEIFNGGEYYLDYNLIGDIKINNLTYSYNSNKLFDNLNLTIKKGQNILLRGKSGSGKSTLMKMLMRYIEIEYNHISINNIDINHYHLELLRKRVLYLSSNEYLYTNSIYYNIALNRKIDESNLKKVIKLTLTEEIINKSKLGLDSIIEENGFNYSSGERQRIILSRALLKDADIFIFDEALSQIDIEKERIILKNIFKYLKEKTIIVISHRFNNEDLFDRVLSLENKKINGEDI